MNILIVYLLDDTVMFYLLNTTDKSKRDMALGLHNRIANVDDLTREELSFLANIDTHAYEIEEFEPTMIDHIVSTGWY